MPFQPGNQLGAKRKLFEAAIRRAVAQDNADRLRKTVERMLDSAAYGDTWAERIAAAGFLRDTLDGKPTQRIESDSGEARALSLSDLATLILQHRAQSATDALPALSESATAAEGGGGEGDIPVDQP